MITTLKHRTALYTSRPKAYSHIDANIIDGTALIAASNADEFTRAKNRLLSNAQIIIVDFEGFSDPSPYSFFMEAIAKLSTGKAYAVAGLGIADFAVENFTTEEAEKSAIARARQETRLGFLANITELESWLRSLQLGFDKDV